MFRRLFSTTTSRPTASAISSQARNTFKKVESRKTYLVDVYSQLLRSNAVVLAVHNSTLLKAEDAQMRRELRKAGATLTVVRSNIFKVALRGLNAKDPASIEAHREFGKIKPDFGKLLEGPSAVITIPELEPKVVDKVVSLIDKTKGKLLLLGGLVDGANSPVLERANLDSVRKLPTLPELQAQLAGVLTILGGAGLVQTLEASSNVLYLTLKSHAQSENADRNGTENSPDAQN